ncbi:putative nitroreductase family protein [Sarocladium strictum]
MFLCLIHRHSNDEHLNNNQTTLSFIMTKLTAQPFLELSKNRRSYYKLSKNLPISNDRVQEIVGELLRHSPTPFNAQTNRVVILFGDEHKKLWKLARETCMSLIAAAVGAEGAGARFDGFENSAATIMFFTDNDKVKGFQEAYAFVAPKWPIWATQAEGMLQYAVWTALEAEGLGCSLQHFNPEIDEKVASTFDLPTGWKLSAQMVIGGITDPSELPDKAFEPLEDRLKVLGA